MCDDPKGVEESATITKMEHKCRGRVSSKTEREEAVSKGGAMEECHSSSSCQLLEVSRGAHKLNQVISSWSRGVIWCDQHSKDIAKDLLKGALGLQDSLHVLGKLQEASHLARLKKKEKEKYVVIRRVNSSPVSERNYQKGILNPHISADVSSRDCIEGVREVIRDSLARQNLLHNIHAEEMRCFSSRYADSASDVPSTSSSRSSSFQTDNVTSMASSVWSATEEKKARSPSLIAKLMGLEEMPLKSWQTHSQKDMEKNKIFSQQRPTFEIDTPKLRKSQFVLPTEDPKTLKDILETMHFKGLLKNNYIKEIKPDSPPIVLIRPRHDPHLRLQETFAPVFQEEGSLNSETVLRKPKVKEDSPSKIIDSNNRGLNFGKTSRREEAKETPMKRHIQQEGGKGSRENEIQPVKKEVKIKQSLPTKAKSSGFITRPSLKKVATPKNIDMMPKPMIGSRKPVKKEIAKAKNSSRSKDQAKVSPQKPSKPENTSNVTKSKILHQPSATSNSNSVRRPQNIVRGPIAVKKSSTKKAVSKATVAKITTEKLECKGDKVVLEGKKIDVASNNDTVLEGKGFDPELEYDTIVEGYGGTETAEQLSTEEGTEHTDIQIGEHCCESSVCDVTLVTINDQNSRKSIGEVDDDPISPIGTDSESFTTGTSLQALLLSSPAFMNHVDELFNLHVDVPTTSQKTGINDFSGAGTRPSLDCVNEIVRRKSHPDSRMIHPPWLSLVGNTKRHISLDHLLKETCDGVEVLRSYSELAGGNYPTDNLYTMLERDINHSEALSGIWDLGWKKGFSVDDTIQVVEDIEKQLLRGLIAEICA
ncbi:hypothetical protein V6N12_052051 [Hibiscus sabdariffa]|uniref:DUF3741 domain-containing protein n=1 Tax=Hibiscus sabdariffa TaxID=183260 RepID=A0ABR2GI60_9ROSI